MIMEKKNNYNSELNRFKMAINNNNNFLITTHTSPDGDGIGSILALGIVLENIGKNVSYYVNDDLPVKYSFLNGFNKISTEYYPRKPQVILVLDCGDFKRTGLLQDEYKNNKSTIINIDHHISNSVFGDINIIDVSVSSTGELIYNLFDYLGYNISKDIAESIYTAIVTDTGSFSYSNTTSDTHTVASKLIAKGISPEKITEKIYWDKSLESLKLLSYVINNLSVSSCGNYAWAYINQMMIKDLELKDSDMEHIVNYTREIKNVKLGILFKEIEINKIKVSFRSKTEDINVAEIAGKFNGGGHFKASGCVINNNINFAIQTILDEVNTIFKVKK